MKANLIDGAWVAAAEVTDNLSPADRSDLIGRYASGDAGDVDRAAEAARRAFPGWSEATPQLRADLLDRVADALLARSDEIGRLLAREEGKTLAEARAEAVRAAQIFRFFAGEALRIAGEAIASTRPGVTVEVTREPVGVVGLITPWNFPIAIPAWKVAPALAYGNTVILKPAELTPGSAHLLAEIIEAAGIPKGVFNLVMGRGSVVGEAIVRHPGIHAISFTGSAPVGRALAIEAAKELKRVQLEMGGKNPMVILDDADLDLAIEICINGAFFSTGQRCTASSRIIVERGIHDQFVERFSARAAGLRVDNPLAPETEIGPVASEAQIASNLDWCRIARDEGCEVRGGDWIDGPGDGFYQRPAVFLGANNAMRSSREEIFGPTASIIKVVDFEEALAVANDTDFGLTSGICTTSLNHARAFRQKSEAGMVTVNLPTAGVDHHVPFGGRKGSSFGPREQGRHAADFYTSTKTAYEFAG